MKKLFSAVFIMFIAVSFAAAAEKGKETPASIYEKIIEKSYVGKYKSLIMDKELASSQLPGGMSVKSKTYYANDKFREETTTQDQNGQTINIVTIFTPEDTFISYDAGENFFSMGATLIDEISANTKDIDPFSSEAVLLDQTESINGKECYLIEDIGDGLNKKFYVEKKTYNLVKILFSNDEVAVTTDMSNYKKVNKFTAPYNIKMLIERKGEETQTLESEIKVLSMQFNPSIKEDMFVPKNVSSLPDMPGMGDIKEMIQSIF